MKKSFGWVGAALDPFLVVIRERHMYEATEAKRWNVRLRFEYLFELHPPLPAASLECTPLRRTEHGQPTAQRWSGRDSGLPMLRQIGATTCPYYLFLQCYHAPTSNPVCLGGITRPDSTPSDPRHP